MVQIQALYTKFSVPVESHQCQMSNSENWAAPEPCQLSSGMPDGLLQPT